jgi:hypothetical protein
MVVMGLVLTANVIEEVSTEIVSAGGMELVEALIEVADVQSWRGALEGASCPLRYEALVKIEELALREAVYHHRHWVLKEEKLIWEEQGLQGREPILLLQRLAGPQKLGLEIEQLRQEQYSVTELLIPVR